MKERPISAPPPHRDILEVGKTRRGAVGGGLKRLLALPLLTLAILAALLSTAAQDPPPAFASHVEERRVWFSDEFNIEAIPNFQSDGCNNDANSATFKCSPTNPNVQKPLNPNSFTELGTTYTFERFSFNTRPSELGLLAIRLNQELTKSQLASWTLHFKGTTPAPVEVVRWQFPFKKATVEHRGGDTTLYWQRDGAIRTQLMTDVEVKITAKPQDAGEIDPTFGIGGKIATALQAKNSQINDIAIQEDGKIVAAGYVENGTTSSPNKDFALARYLPNGALDSSFGNGGKIITAFGTGDDIANAVAIQSDGKIVAAGKARAVKDVTNDNDDLAIARYMPNGELDPNFGTSGKKVFGRGPSEIGHALAIQSDGKIVVVGRIAKDMAVWRYKADGSTLDTGGFNKDATLTSVGDANHPSGPGFNKVSWGAQPETNFDEARAMLLHKDNPQLGKIAVAGRTENRFAMARFLANGLPDNTFNSNGKVNYVVSGVQATEASALSITPNRKNSTYYIGGYYETASNNGFVGALHRFNNGKLICWNPDNTSCDDTTSTSQEKVNTQSLNVIDRATAIAFDWFSAVIVGGFAVNSGVGSIGIAGMNPEGGALFDFLGDSGKKKVSVGGSDDRLYAMKGLEDGSYVTAGYASLPTGKSSGKVKHFSLVKFTNNLELDINFGIGGKVTTPFGVGTNRIEDIKVLDNNKILAVGSVGEGKAASFHPDADVAVFRFNANGTLDTTFGTGGIVRLDRDSNEDRGHALLVKSDGKILVAGTSRNSLDSASGLAVVQLNSDGTIDTNFGDSGWANAHILGGGEETANAIAEDSTGRIILAGLASAGGGVSSLGIGVLKANGTKDASFGNEADDAGDKRFLFNGQVGLDVAEAVAVDSNDSIVVAGWTEYNSDGDTKVALARVTAAGALDSTFGADGNGKVQSGFGTDFAKANAMAFDGDKIMIAGRMGTKEDGNFLLARYTANGTLDTTFNDTGYIEIDIGGKSNEVHALKRAASGSWSLVGSSGVGDDAGDLAIVRVRSDATIDGHFGVNRTGITTTKISNESEAGLAVDFDSGGNRIVVGGTVVVQKGTSSIVPRDYFTLARYFHRVIPLHDTRLAKLELVPRKDGTDGTAKIIRSSNPKSPFAYSATLPAGSTHFKLKPTASQTSGATISVTMGANSQEVSSGAKSSAFAIPVSSSVAVTVTVTASDTKTQQAYTVKITRPADTATTTPASTDAGLSSVLLQTSIDGSSFDDLATISSPNPSSSSNRQLPRNVKHVRFTPTASAASVATITASWPSQSSVTIASGSNSQSISVTVDTSLSIGITVTPESGAGDAQTYTINLTWEAAPSKNGNSPSGPDLFSSGGGNFAPPPANDPPTFAESSFSLTVDENSSAGSLVGEPVTATDADGDTITYALEGESAELFEINPRTGQITVAEGVELDFESETNEFTFTVTATDEDGSGQSARAEITIAVADVELPDAVAQYDINFNEQIELQELLAALRDFVEGKLTLPQITAIILHFLTT